MSTTSASCLSKHDECIIDDIMPCQGYLKLLELGVKEGSSIRLKNKAPFDGPFCFCINSSDIFIRKETAECILVSSKK